MNKATSIPGAPLFRSISTVIIFLICFTVFLVYSNDISNKVDLIARASVIKEINVALSMRLYRSTIEGTLAELASIHKKNPFQILKSKGYSVPKDYVGQISGKAVPEISGWYYDENQQVIFYWAGDARLFQSQLQFVYRDINDSGHYEPSIDVIEKLEMVSQ
jgi:hypothetical protein